MKISYLCIALLVLVFICGCRQEKTRPEKAADPHPVSSGETAILQSWHGDYPVAQLRRLPVGLREVGIGFLIDAETFKAVWEAFMPGEVLPGIDFKTNIVLFARNTQFYNHIRISKVKVTNYVAVVMAAETMSAMPIGDKVAMSMVVVARQGISAVQSGDSTIQIYK